MLLYQISSVSMEWPNASWENYFRPLNCYNWSEIFLHANMCRIAMLKFYQYNEEFHSTLVLLICLWNYEGLAWKCFLESILLRSLVATLFSHLPVLPLEECGWSLLLSLKVVLLNVINCLQKHLNSSAAFAFN